MKEELNVQKSLCKWLKLQYPRMVFFSDMSGLKTTIGVAVQMKALRSGNAIPDLFIACPANGKAGLFLEIKRDVAAVWRKDGTLRKNEHVAEQFAMLMYLRDLGYAAEFGYGLDDCISKVKNYFSN